MAKTQEAPEEATANAAAAARPMWSGTVSFGLVSIPVRLAPAVRRGGISLRMLSPSGTPLARRYFGAEGEQNLQPEQIQRGYEIGPDRYVIITDEELESLEPKKSRDIDLTRFVEVKEIDPMYFERPYFLLPEGDSTKAYRLLAQAMEKAGKAGIATFVMRDKQYLIAIIAEHGILRAETLRFQDEIRTPEEIGLPARHEVKEADVAEITREIKKLAEPKLAIAELKDRHTEKLMKLIEAKNKKGAGVVQVEVADEDAEAETGSVTDLMEQLKRSMKAAGRGGGQAEKRRRKVA